MSLADALTAAQKSWGQRHGAGVRCHACPAGRQCAPPTPWPFARVHERPLNSSADASDAPSADRGTTTS